ncbi:uncharacterized protein BDZ99DRAFT_576172 [Mytilinidion resinicola]|uniref:Uncharacterized protein n=1 Tax=Mytilinidion resinicola TaxID=574789 RepID=A0A6A6Y4U9_9PEZI|nr:uncharacterized protein BDZ99DRAFT_576172 [Mytilinidion resinicola]KAF2803255.1 hypothetical protein BDZ99DRAFT_576172 [Mytilinidion resinicola]
MKLDTSLAIIFGTVTVLQVLGALVKFIMRLFHRRRLGENENEDNYDLEPGPPSTISRTTQLPHSTGVELDTLAPPRDPSYLDWPVLPSPYDESSREQREWGAL